VSQEKHGTLIDRLIKKTQDRSLEWKTSLLEGRYQISFRDNTVRIHMVDGGDDGSPFENPMVYLELINDEGIVAETINDEELDRDIPVEKHFWFKKMTSLFELARRSALGSDKILDEILTDLDDDVPF